MRRLGVCELQPPVCLGMVAPMGTVRRACMRLGIVATGSLLMSLAVMMLLVETPQIAEWFLASAALAGLSYAAALVANYLEQ